MMTSSRARRFLVEGGVAVALCLAAVAQACSADPPMSPVGDAGGSPLLDGALPPADAADASDAKAERDPCAEASPPVCPPAAVWDVPVALPIPGKFASMSSDELHVAYYVGGADGGPATIEVASRAAVTDPFGAGRAFGFAADPAGVSLSKDGLDLLATYSGDVRVASRPSVAANFGTPGRPGFQFGGEDQLFAGPVFLASGGFLLGRTTASVGQMAFTQIEKVGDAYQQVPLIPQAELLSASGGAEAPRPSGMSSDGRALFFYEASKKSAKVAHRPAPSCPYTRFVDLGDLPGVQPNVGCTALYYRDPVAGGLLRVARKP